MSDALSVTSNVTILGAGARLTRVLGSGADRVFTVSGATVTISSLAMAGGDVICCGGNLSNVGGTVTLDHVRVTDGNATGGGGIANESGTMTIVSSLIDANIVATSNGNGDGGGILNIGGNGQANLTVRDTTIAGNRAQSTGRRDHLPQQRPADGHDARTGNSGPQHLAIRVRAGSSSRTQGRSQCANRSSMTTRRFRQVARRSSRTADRQRSRAAAAILLAPRQSERRSARSPPGAMPLAWTRY